MCSCNHNTFALVVLVRAAPSLTRVSFPFTQTHPRAYCWRTLGWGKYSNEHRWCNTNSKTLVGFGNVWMF